MFCGEIVDDVIIENRQWLKKGVVSGNRKVQSGLGKKARDSLHVRKSHGLRYSGPR